MAWASGFLGKRSSESRGSLTCRRGAFRSSGLGSGARIVYADPVTLTTISVATPVTAEVAIATNITDAGTRTLLLVQYSY